MDSLIVQMPRFNKNVFEPGMAIEVTDKGKYDELPRLIGKHCLVKKVSALFLDVLFIDIEGEDVDDYSRIINVDDVASGMIVIEILTVSTPRIEVGDEDTKKSFHKPKDTKDFSTGRL
jgi:hypothetical protein